MLNPTGGNREYFNSAVLDVANHSAVGGRCGYVWGATGFICYVAAYFGLPEMKGRSYRELDIMFKRRVPARKFKETVITVEEDE
jgi:SP family general alpha glucoside:H+ symporter-like MFS transporter